MNICEARNYYFVEQLRGTLLIVYDQQIKKKTKKFREALPTSGALQVLFSALLSFIQRYPLFAIFFVRNTLYAENPNEIDNARWKNVQQFYPRIH